jgi:hypothetical protein
MSGRNAKNIVMSEDISLRQDVRDPNESIKRKRGPIACLNCRDRKRKCDSLQPTCGHCRNHEWLCKWPEGDRRKTRFRQLNNQSSYTPGVIDERNEGIEEFRIRRDDLNVSNSVLADTNEGNEGDSFEETATYAIARSSRKR